MANIFDKDTASTDNHLLNEQFHTFSKSPSSPGSTLGGASNRSGHTVSASDVWAEKIPAFFYPKADSDYAVCKANAKLNDICRWGDEIQIWDGEKFVKFADNYAAIPDGHEFLNEEGQPVVRFHKSRVAYNLNDTNNAYDNSLDASGKGASAKILGWDKTANDGAGGVYTYVESAPQFITQFVAPTDNIVKGVPSKGYGPIVMVGGSPLTEDADSTAGYIANNFAGIIQFNERKAQGTVTVHAFEYCGKTLGTAAKDIAELDEKIGKISVTASGGLQGVSEDATTAGLSTKWVKVVDGKEVDAQPNEEGAHPVLTISTGTIDADADDKLVTGSTVKTYVDDATAKATVSEDGVVTEGDENKLVTATSAQYIAEKVVSDAITDENGVIADAIDSAISGATLTAPEGSDDAIADTEDTSKLVTAEQVKTYVENNAKVTVIAGDTTTDEGEAVTSLTVKGGATGNVTVTVENDETDTAEGSKTLTVSASIPTVTIDDVTKLPTEETKSGFVTGEQSQAVASQVVTNALADDTEGSLGATIASKVADVTVDGASVVDSTTKVAALTTTQGDEITADANADATSTVLATEASVAKSLATIEGEITGKNVGVTDDATAVGLNASGNAIGITTADYTKAEYDENGKVTTEGSWTDASKNYLVTGDVVRNFVGDETAKALEEAKAYSDGLHSANLVYIVLGDDETLPTAGPDTVGKIYLVKEGNAANGEANIDAISGAYVEYMTRKVSETEYTWEKIGTTATDLSGYAKSITLGTNNSVDVSNNVIDLSGKVITGISVASTGVTGNVDTNTGSLTLTVTEATVATDGNEAIKGIVALTDTVDSTDSTMAVTGKAVSAATATTNLVTDEGTIIGDVADEDANKFVTASQIHSAISLAKPESYIISVADGKTDEEGNNTNITSGQVETLVIKDSRENVYDNDLWGTSVTLDTSTNTITVDQKYLSNPNASNISSGRAWLTNVTKVEDNKAYNGDTVVANVQTDMIKDGSFMFNRTSLLTSFSGDLSSLVNGDSMFFYTSLESFSGDLSSLVNGANMFYETPLESFSGDLSSLVNGVSMFSGVSLTSFTGDLSSLVNGSSMFNGAYSLKSFSGDLSNLVNGVDMFHNCRNLTSFSGDLSSLVNGEDMFNSTSLKSFSGDLSSLVNGNSMFDNTSLLTSFSGDLSSLVDGGDMFYHSSIASFSGDLSSLVNGIRMFHYTYLDVESVELICDVLPNYNTEKLQTATWNISGENKGKYTYSDWEEGSDFYYPIINISGNYDDFMSQGNADGIDRSFGTASISESNVKTITIYWDDISVLSESDRNYIAELFTNTANEKGWTFIVNTEIAESGEIAPPNAVMATDGTIQYYVFAKKDEATEDNATHIDASGKLWKFDTAEAIIGPNIKYWSMFATFEDALTEWELTPWTKPTEEETEEA